MKVDGQNTEPREARMTGNRVSAVVNGKRVVKTEYIQAGMCMRCYEQIVGRSTVSQDDASRDFRIRVAKHKC